MKITPFLLKSSGEHLSPFSHYNFAPLIFPSFLQKTPSTCYHYFSFKSYDAATNSKHKSYPRIPTLCLSQSDFSFSLNKKSKTVQMHYTINSNSNPWFWPTQKIHFSIHYFISRFTLSAYVLYAPSPFHLRLYFDL